MIYKVRITVWAERSLKKCPKAVAVKFLYWKRLVEEHGLENVRRLRGFNDEALQGKLAGLRSIRLSAGYRAYYRKLESDVECILVEEVNKHEYKKIERRFGA